MELKNVSTPNKSSQINTIKDPLLKDVQGDIIMIRSPQGVTVCVRNAADTEKFPLWLRSIVYSKAMVAGHVSKKGGRFKFIGKEQAVKVICNWMLEQLHCPSS